MYIQASEIMYPVVPAIEAVASHLEPGAGETEDPKGDAEGPAAAQCQAGEPSGTDNRCRWQ